LKRGVFVLVEQHRADIRVRQEIAANPERREIRGRHGPLLALLNVQRAD